MDPAQSKIIACVEPSVGEFFASRSGVCVYVRVRGKTFRVQFARIDADGIVAEDTQPGALEALECARLAIRKHQAELAHLFEKVARGQT
jgi:hypothetical protein